MSYINFNKEKVDQSIKDLSSISYDLKDLTEELSRAVSQLTNTKGFEQYVGDFTQEDINKCVVKAEDSIREINNNIVEKEFVILNYDGDYSGLTSFGQNSYTASSVDNSTSSANITDASSTNELIKVIFELNDDAKTQNIVEVEKGKTVPRPQDPIKPGYKFNGWYLNGYQYNFYAHVTYSFTLNARYIEDTDNEDDSEEIPTIFYRFASTASPGKWIFMNNPEKLHSEHLVENSKRAVYSSYIPANTETEIYYEHVLSLEDNTVDKPVVEGYFCFRFHNPSSSIVQLTINSAGSSIIRGNDGAKYIETWQEFYRCKYHPLKGQTFSIGPNNNLFFYVNATPESDTSWAVYEGELSTTVPSSPLPACVFDGAISVKATGKLNFETFLYKDSRNIPAISVDHCNNFVDGVRNNNYVYCGELNKLPYIVADIEFKITSKTKTGPLKVKYESNGNPTTLTTPQEQWITHYKGYKESTKSDCELIDLVSLDGVGAKRKVGNWANWGVHYTEKISLKNTSKEPKIVAYYVYAVYGGVNGMASSLIAFAKDQNIKYIRNRFKDNGGYYFGEWTKDSSDQLVWEVEVQPGETLIVPTEVLLGGNCTGAIGRKVVLLDKAI